MKNISIVLLMLLLHVGAKGQEIAVGEPIRFLALGDSYTIGQGVDKTVRWPNQLIDRLEEMELEVAEFDIIARTGWRTDDLQAAIDQENPSADYNLVSLLIGVNNQFQGSDFGRYSSEFTALLNQAIALCGGDKTGVFVLSIPDYGYTPFGSSNKAAISAEIDLYNQTNKRISDEMGVAYIDITPISREAESKPEYVASDNLHPSGSMYEEWVNEIRKKIVLKPPIVLGLEKQTAEWNLYPNPAINHARFSSIKPIASIRIYNLLGFEIQYQVAQGQRAFALDLSDLASGVYYYNIVMVDKALGSGKLVVR